MAKFKPATYTRPAPVEKDNPFVEHLRPFAEKGIDTAFEVETTAAEYKADKIQIQKAVNILGFSAREVENTWDDELAPSYEGSEKITAKFLIRPRRKAKGEGDAEQPAAE